ncbi:DEAD/DEAH box helicase [Psychrobacillus lasiicapitis]|uniref:DEAD/DEAH box helicase n=1 Tax=Psychrobacillus lasiicapitis TaxID=1636719 RepID=A0A544TBU6_9BACI|nr:DEAD/DEAH box helicase [Psychrobacillus lasiicapitis]TQR14927.1 DEAD/DEAH box helicase [Psychrobacillus lasiicapitis]GGA21106.1 putative ATP-dependent helicase YwqA [Psychrobacillus lasiicapitis]
MTQPLSITKDFSLHIHATENGNFHLTTAISPAEQWVPYLYIDHRESYFGLNTQVEDNALIASPVELVELFSGKKHPFVTFSGVNEDSNNWLQTFKEAANVWASPNLWDQLQLKDNRFEVKAPIDEKARALISNAVTQKLYQAGLTLEDIPALIPFFQQGGWPIKSQTKHPNILVALRLSEPEALDDTWLLETVVRGKKSSVYWTPAYRKKMLPIKEALPDKWSEFSSFIEEIQSKMFSLISSIDSLNPDIFFSSTLSDEEVRIFLRDDLVKLQALGFEIVLPAWLKAVKDTKMRVKTIAKTANTYKTTAGLNEILQFNWSFSLNGQEISTEDFQRLVSENRSYIQAGNEWFRIDAAWMHEIRELMKKSEDENWTVKELLFREIPEEMALMLDDDEESDEDPLFQFEMQKSLQTLMEQLSEKKGFPAVAVSPNLLTTLRPYQQLGLEWLAFMRNEQFGACLADDMGLGKTVQLISYLLHVHENEKRETPSLIICPTSVLGNWQKELAKFAPSLKVQTHYGSTRTKEIDLTADVVITTFGTAMQDAESLEEIVWSSITLDEAQNIKNMHTKQSRAIRKLKGAHHIALTGTPVENRLSELWSIFDFIHKGYLGSFGKFQENYIVPIERDNSNATKHKLRVKIQPFLLRRTKQDPELLLNLPEKLEQREYCALTTEQAALYESLIQETVSKLDTLSGFEKKGLILKMLSKLKQLCNHPALYLKEPFDDAEDMLERSEKLAQIVTLAGEIAARGEQCLIFTQYIGMGHLLQHCLTELYEVDAPFLTGSMPKNQRDHLVAAFQAKEFPVFLLSLKAGGTGLNLTAASHVLHADRWWNPAVENQATDRAYRIGQTNFVHVHKFITIGTIEEKIDKLLEEKQALSEELIHSSQWITEMSDADIKDLLTLSI